MNGVSNPMSERASKLFLAAEAVFLVVPVTYLFLLWFSVAIPLAVADDGIIDCVIAAVAGIALLSGWRLMIVFWRRGARALAHVSIFTWVGSFVGAAATVVGSVLTLNSGGQETEQPFSVLLVGFPLLIPLGHLVIEWQSLGIANKPLKNDARAS